MASFKGLYMGDVAEGDTKNSHSRIIDRLNRRARDRTEHKTDESIAASPADEESENSESKLKNLKRKCAEVSSKKKKKKRKLETAGDTESVPIKEFSVKTAGGPPVILNDDESSPLKSGQPSITGDAGLHQSEEEDGEDDEVNGDVAPADPGHQGHAEVGGFTVIGDIKQKTVEKVQRVLPFWLLNPTVIADDIRHSRVPLDDVRFLDAELIRRLRENNITHLFPVQNVLIPELLGGMHSGHVTCHMGGHVSGVGGYYPNDVCCSAPTGSGKTLAFVLPIVQMLKQRVVCQVRALVVLPVHDLASQVYNVFQTYCQGTKLKVALIVGQKPFASEQHALVAKGLRGYSSQADIVVATPGRLVDHISQTTGFQLAHLRYLVIDEADRMMAEIQHDWLTQVEDAVYACDHRRPIRALTVSSVDSMTIPLQKMLFSATLSQNPEKLQLLHLFQPRLYTSVVTASTSSSSGGEMARRVGPGDILLSPAAEFVGKYTTPSGLTEYFIESTAGHKPLHVLHLLHHMKYRHVLCFTNSVESTHRLYCLISLVGRIKVEEFSSRLQAAKRARILQRFAAGKIDMLICSDAMARGMDIEHVQCVVSYDLPTRLRTYVHRVGRTARAGRVGTAISLLEKKQIFHFKKMIQEAGKTGVKELKYPQSRLKPLLQGYTAALEQLPTLIQEEKRMKKM